MKEQFDGLTEFHSEPPAPAAGAEKALRFLMGLVEGAAAALNGIAGDHADKAGSNLAIPMRFHHERKPLELSQNGILAAHPRPGAKAAVFVHGLCCNERIWWFFKRPNVSYGALLHRDLGHTPFYLRYNTGLHVSENGRRLAGLLEKLVEVYPGGLRELVLVGHSKGGLVLRSACHYGRKQGHAWPRKVSRVILLGSPHLGAPLEKAANIASWGLTALPWKAARHAGDFLNLRSSAIKDLRFGYTLEEEWAGADPDALMENHRRAPGFLPWAPHYLAAASLTKNPRHLATWILGDFLVRTPSALGLAGKGAAQVRIFPKTNHFALTMHPKVYWQIKDWCQTPIPS